LATDDQNRAVARDEEGHVTLTIPCTPEYVGTARLTILGVASRMGFTYDQVEDIRLAVGEACTNAIERASTAGDHHAMITIHSHIQPTRLTVEVEDHTNNRENGATSTGDGTNVDGMNSQELGALLMEILVDEVTVEPTPGGGTLVRLVKLANEA
jgi:serine/threonine-protein kinase RsbW